MYLNSSDVPSFYKKSGTIPIDAPRYVDLNVLNLMAAKISSKAFYLRQKATKKTKKKNVNKI